MKNFRNKLVLVGLIFSPLIFLANAKGQDNQGQDKLIEKTQTEEQRPSTQRSFSLSAGYTSRTLKSDFEEFDGNGLDIGVGKVFDLKDGFSTTSSLTASFFSYDEDDLGLPSVDVKSNEVGISQRLIYDFEAGKGIFLRPFLEGGFSLGKMKLNTAFDDGLLLNGDLESKISYTKFGVALGLQVALAHGFTPFVKYQRSRVKYDDKADVEGTLLGESFSSEEFLGGSSDERKYTSNSFTLGLAYLF